jgi:hypothetical protein
MQPASMSLSGDGEIVATRAGASLPQANEVEAVKAPASASAGDSDDAGDGANLGEVGAHAAPASTVSESDADAGAATSLIAAASSDGSELMQGLLLLGAGEAPAEEGAGDSAGAVQDALAVAEGETFIDDLVEQLGAQDGGDGDNAGGENLAAILNVDVSGDAVMLNLASDFNQTMEDASAAAAA